MLYWIIVNI